MRHVSQFVLLSLLAGTAVAQSVTVIGPGSGMSVSPDGQFVVGGSNNEAYLWSAASGSVALPGAAWARAIGDDASVILGETAPPFKAVLWDEASGWQSIDPGFAGCDAYRSNPFGISDDGSVAVGLGWQGCDAFAFRWTQATGMQPLPQMGPIAARANNISGDGLTIGGWDEAPTGERRAAIWWPDGTEELVTVSPSNPIGMGEVWGFSTDGTWATGQGPSGTAAWLYSKATGMIDLGAPASASAGLQGVGRAISDDGQVVVGNHGGFAAWRAVIWRNGHGMQYLDEYLNDLGLTVPNNLYVTDMTPDGRHIVGHTTFGPFIGDAFIVDLEGELCGYGSYGEAAGEANVLVLAGSGSTALGETATLTTTNANGGMVITFASLGEASLPFLGGTVLIDPTQSVASFTEVPVARTAQSSIALPANPLFAGLSVYLQSVGDDLGQPEGWALSNGLKLVFCE